MSAQRPQSRPRKPQKLGPYSAVLRRGAIGTSIDGRSTEGRYLRDFEKQMADHLGGKPSTPQTLLISRAARTSLAIMLFEAKMVGDGWTDLDARTYAGLQTSLVRMLTTLGLAAPDRPERSVGDILKAINGTGRGR